MAPAPASFVSVPMRLLTDHDPRCGSAYRSIAEQAEALVEIIADRSSVFWLEPQWQFEVQP